MTERSAFEAAGLTISWLFERSMVGLLCRQKIEIGCPGLD
jgi:hypothetical protein